MSTSNISKKVLYISYDGMTDPLGQSQVIPYLIGLSEYGYEIDILSVEKKKAFLNRKQEISKTLSKHNISWHTLNYSKNPPVLSTLWDIYKLKQKAKKLSNNSKYDIVHCRSYIAAFIGMYLKKKYGTKFLFDMRGFFADERVDGNLWSQKNPIYRLIYRYFKKKEKEFFLSADYTISLTYSGKEIIHKFPDCENIKIEVIPCCADLELFNFSNVNHTEKDNLTTKLNISKDNFVLTYLGSVGTWYMLDEMMEFFKVLKRKKKNSKFLFITKDDSNIILKSAEKNSVNKEDILITAANREEVPLLLSVSNVSIFFIKPVFSKKASSPTKLAELLGMGIPAICNLGVGDIDKFTEETEFGLQINNFQEAEYEKIIDNIDSLKNLNPLTLRKFATEQFSLEVGVSRYLKVYKKLAENE